MCLILFAWQAHPDYPLVVAANRDEWRDRPTAPAAWWDDAPDILAGRDLEAGGTWLGVTRAGRFAAITNFRDPSDRKSTAPSRGQLVADFLRGDDAPRDYLAALAAKAARYNGFNLLLADDKSMCYFGSREGEIIDVAPGIHGLSNHLLDEPWPKVKNGKSALGAAFETKMPQGALLERSFDILSNTMRAPDATLPNTGVGLEWERVLSPALIVTEKYGTRCSTVLLRGEREIVFEERTRGDAGEVTLRSVFRFAPPAAVTAGEQ
ncbi:MAG TPA: NRDE family protein [Usitatibacteraceae bacterium]